MQYQLSGAECGVSRRRINNFARRQRILGDNRASCSEYIAEAIVMTICTAIEEVAQRSRASGFLCSLYCSFLVSFFLALLFKQRGKSSISRGFSLLSNKRGSKLCPRMGGVTPNPQSQNGSLWRPPPADLPAKVLSHADEVRPDPGVAVDDTSAAV